MEQAPKPIQERTKIEKEAELLREWGNWNSGSAASA